MTDNELIAKFMGLPLTKKTRSFVGGTEMVVPFMNWKYHTSWDCLMPVVEKIKNMTPDLFNYNVKSMTEFRQWYAQIQSISIFTPIDKVYAILINFIKWYNENKTK